MQRRLGLEHAVAAFSPLTSPLSFHRDLDRIRLPTIIRCGDGVTSRGGRPIKGFTWAGRADEVAIGKPENAGGARSGAGAQRDNARVTGLICSPTDIFGSGQDMKPFIAAGLV